MNSNNTKSNKWKLYNENTKFMEHEKRKKKVNTNKMRENSLKKKKKDGRKKNTLIKMEKRSKKM